MPGPRLLIASLLLHSGVWAQEIIRNDESLSPTRPEAWAMNYVAASTLMTAFGETPTLAPWRWQVAADLGHVPRLSESDQRVGFDGTKQEDLNRSPVFGRLRVVIGLPAGFVAEAGYTPPLSIRNTRPRDLFAVAIGRRVLERENFTLSLRVFGQYGRATGDLTCPRRLAGAGLESNPDGCRAPSDDQITLGYYGIDATTAWVARAWRVHANVGAARTDLAVQVDALTFDVRDRSRLVARATKPFAAVGASRDLDANWSLGAELLYVPLRVQRGPDAASGNDPFTSFRLQLRYRFN